MSECGLTPPDITVESVNLAAGANFDPNGFLKINSKATVPVLEVDGKRYKDSTNVTEQIMKLSPNPPKKDTRTDHELAKVIQAVHSEKHDPVAMFFLPVDDAEREAKAKGFAGGYVASRQKALDKWVRVAVLLS
jgi:glutathione S-transferase